MRFKELHLSSAFAFAFALTILITGCSKDDVKEIVGVCPIVVSTIPEDGDVDVPLTQVISATFNEELNPKTVNSQTFKVSGSSAVAGTVTYSGKTAFFTPSSNLMPNVIYTATVTTGIKDPMGNALQEDYVWSFTTIPEIKLSSSPLTDGTTSGAGMFNNGSTVTVNAVANEGFKFANWTLGDKIVSTNANYEFKMNGNISLVANFAIKTYTLNVTAQNGTVAKNPNQETYNHGATVVLTATPATGYKFSSWSGDATGSTNPLTITMNADKNITANFTLISVLYTLKVTAQNGTVSKDPNEQTYNSGATVKLTATPATGYQFSSWSGDATGSTNPLTITMNADKNITANFTLIAANMYTLNVTAQNGTVAKNPNQQTYNSGSTVTLTARPANGYEFSSWSGDASGSQNPLSITMNSNKNITAHFTQTVNAGQICPNPAVDLGAAGNYAILAKSGISTTGTTSITGNLGVSPITSTAITGFGLIRSTDGTYSTSSLVTGRVYASDYTTPTPANLTTSVSNMETAFTTANGLAADRTEYLAGNLNNVSLTSGVYKWGTGLLLSNTITLDGGGVNCAKFVFQIAGDLTVSNDTKIILINGAKADNIFWVVAGAGAKLGTDVNFSGNILSQTLISVNTRSSVNGRLLAQSAVTLNGNAIVKPSN